LFEGLGHSDIRIKGLFGRGKFLAQVAIPKVENGKNLMVSGIKKGVCPPLPLAL